MDGLIFLFIFVLFNALLLFAINAQRNSSFSIDLIHRDSTLSPLYNNSVINGVNHFDSSMYIDSKYVQSEMSHQSGEYLMKIQISESYEVVAIASMISDLIWIQCDPCDGCYPQNKPYFKPGGSTYKRVPFESHFCKALGRIKRGERKGECLYKRYKSSEHKITSGVLSTETFYLQSPDYKPQPYQKIVFGCGTDNAMIVSMDVQGVVGLGRGDLSLVSQLGSKISGKFSYCLRKNHMNTITKLKFGPQPPIQKKTSTLKLFTQPDSSSSLYVLNLKEIRIKGKKLEVSELNRDMVLDIGTTVTKLHWRIYDSLIASLREVIGDEIKPVEDPTGKYSLCYKNKDISGVAIPDMIFKFASTNFLSGSDLTLTPSHTFQNLGAKLCMLIIRSTHAHGRSVLGSAAQKDFRVEYEAGKNKVTFIETSCEENLG
ncbi:probable aspartic protease At2g35615 [Tripterygium wilfordii]|uniref:probable aspartic protease At2g35615 n=1 Tax=Tripterygium wilfordii TaxID=458696 RepID=UPI0018F8017C|nr:probable aspartic protease At2g35615 [Tripterygium wilfordii]